MTALTKHFDEAVVTLQQRSGEVGEPAEDDQAG
jgi:hypothetical protein